jgi:hypothetical protein
VSTILIQKSRFLTAVMLCISVVFSCQHKDKGNDLNSSIEENKSSNEINPNSLKHPQTANEYATRVYVSTVTDQSPEKISECIEQITAISKESSNQDDMQKAVLSTQSLFNQNLPLYHACFYQLAARLDNRLAQGGPLLSELSREFFETTHAMWIMAKALDRVVGKKNYYSYLKQRYVQISRDVFGRSVAPLGDGFDEKKSPGGNVKQTNEKAAGPYKQ